MKKFLLVGLLIGIALAMIGAEPVKVIMATTDDGRRVILMPDGKWNFVEAAPVEQKADQSACKEKLYDEVYSYLSNQWTVANMEKDSLFIQTDWKILPFFASVMLTQTIHEIKPGMELKDSIHPGSVQGKVAVKIQEGCSLKVDSHYQLYMHGWEDFNVEWNREKAKAGGYTTKGAKKIVEFDDKLKADLDALAAKYQPTTKAAAPPSESKP